MSYDSDQYWTERGKTYYQEHKKRPLVKRMVFKLQEVNIAHLLGMITPKTVLDAGCGYGRITRILAEKYVDAREISGFDISEDQLKVAREYCEGFNIEFFEQSILEPMDDGPRWDLVVAVELLMHMAPEDIEDAIDNLTELSRRYILTCDWYEPENPPESDFCFQHDYDHLFYLKGFKILKARRGHRQRIVLWERGK